eukprot:CAMPEP_0178964592 /NCGR_PEP_ID=MMETSP0789-20121207/15767_1 /TAXON_ID=3005 /ORGANISM="Rhizosolenia setigera, Strain CCMP 1694" /LENGTH=419 /DNA_ID=CAMNT_0020649393 /DNA_START=55 /DNA_END=1311 /DNA_ORIENTATION=+
MYSKSLAVIFLSGFANSCVDGFSSPTSTSLNRLPFSSSQQLSSSELPDFDLPEKDDSASEKMKKQEEEDAKKWKQMAEELREQVRDLEEKLPPRTSINNNELYIKAKEREEELNTSPLKNKRVLVVGANGRVGSMVCRYLLRTHPEIEELVAAVHTVSENSVTSRGYGRLSYEVGAEDGIGSIGAAWSAEDRVATFEYNPEVMGGYNLQNLRLVEAELLDPVQCQTITEGVDCVIWCATDFNGNKPRAVSGLNVAFLFRAVASPTKGRVEIEGLQNILEGLTLSRTQRMRQDRLSGVVSNSKNTDEQNTPSFILLSTSEDAFSDFETPYGSFKGIKRQGEEMLRKDFPSISSTILQLSRYDDNFVEENLEVIKEEVETGADDTSISSDEKERRRINRRDAAKAAVDALSDSTITGKILE